MDSSPASHSVDDHIRSVSGMSESLLGELGRSLQRIDEINRTTRIISMNARIEAVRIGVAGRGFGRVTRDVACALPVPDQPDFLWPLLFHELSAKIIDMPSS